MNHVTILGGGLAGLSAAYYSGKRGIASTLLEENAVTGGNCVTYHRGGFHFDSGAHRFLDEYPEVTDELRALLGDDLKPIDVPSRIFDGGRLIDIPFKPLNLLACLGAGTFVRSAAEILAERLKPGGPFESFEDFALRTYGRTIASRFLLNYTEKLWGRPTGMLSPIISGKRLQGLSIREIVKEALLGRFAKSGHREGVFYYPEGGIHTLAKTMEKACHSSEIRVSSKVTAVLHDGRRIIRVEVNGSERMDVDQVVSTLPLDYLIKILDPLPPSRIAGLAGNLRFRDLRVVCFFLDRKSVMKVATLYVPGMEFPFTRLYEPRNRNSGMAPEAKTSLAAEIPCESGDSLHEMSDEELTGTVRSKIIATGLMKESEIAGSATERVRHAYPVLLATTPSEVNEIRQWLGNFENLRLTGRNGRFEYSWIHDMMRAGEALSREYSEMSR